MLNNSWRIMTRSEGSNDYLNTRNFKNYGNGECMTRCNRDREWRNGAVNRNPHTMLMVVEERMDGMPLEQEQVLSVEEERPQGLRVSLLRH